VTQENLQVAIVGVSGCYAGARDARTYWQNILDKVDAVAPADDEWTSYFMDKENWAQRNDRIYTNRGGFLRDLATIDPTEYGVMPSQADGGDPDHLLALKHAGDALADAGYKKRDFDRSRAGVILGRGTYTNRGQANVLFHALFVDEMMKAVTGLRPDFTPGELDDLRERFKKQLPPYSGELVGQLTPNVITGLICNRLNLMGPNYIVDAACASTMMALDQAVRELVTGRSDLMITGGTHAHTPPQLYVQFSQIKALSNGQLRPFQKGHSGTLLGEGVGMLVLKRLKDAEAAGDRIYAVIQGIGVASDGRAKGLLTPRLEGQVLAMRRAYESSGIDPMTIDLIEAHGTGTDVGDATEIETLKALYNDRGTGPQIAVGTVKSMIGHCLPASGSASLIKTALALHHKILPPTLCDEPNPELHLEKSPLYINTETRPWIHGKTHARRAGVNAFGFGGINAHVIMEEYRGPSKFQVQVLHRPSPTELVTLAADSIPELIALAQATLVHLDAKPATDLAAIARASSAHARGDHRLAIVADNAGDLHKKLEQAIDKLSRADAKPFKTRGGLYYGGGAAPGKLCFLYPGEGAQYSNMLADLCLQFPQVRDWFDFIESTALRNGAAGRANALFPAPTGLDDTQRKALEARLYEMDVAAESVFAASMSIQTLLEDIGLKPDAMLGHSTGENTAITACKVRRFKAREEIAESVRDLNKIFRKLEAEGRIAEGTLLSIGALRPELRAELLAGSGSMQVAMDNCPNQLVMFGPPAEAQALSRRLAQDEGAICQELPFGRAYHTPLFKPLADAYREYFAAMDFGPGSTTLYSARSVGPFPSEPDAIRELAAQQWENPVRFTDTLRKLYDDGYRVFVEVGPSGNLTSFVGDTLRDCDDVVAVSSNSRRKDDMAQLHAMLAQLFTSGVSFEPAALYAHREIAEIELLTEPKTVARRNLQIKLQMPTLRVPTDWAPAQRAMQKPQIVVKEVIKEVVREVDRASIAPGAAAPSAPAYAKPSDPRMAALKSHFSLMQNFLDSQARVLGGMPAGGAVIAPAMPSVLASAVNPIQMPTPTFVDPSLDPNYPMLGQILSLDTQQLVSQRLYTAHTDLFLLDHAIGLPPSARAPELLPLIVVPFTFSMEVIAEAACKLAGDALKVVAIEACRGHRWLSLDNDKRLGLRIVAERLRSPIESPRVAVKLFQLDPYHENGVPTLVFEGHVTLAERYPAPPQPRALSAGALLPARTNPPGELYRHGMFHGPRLQGVKHLRGWNEDGIEADMATIATRDYFSFTSAPKFRIDAALLDAAGQLAGYWLTEKLSWGYKCFPYNLGHYTQFADPLPADRQLLCRADIKIATHKIDCQFDLIDSEGQLIARAANWEDVKYSAPQNLYRFRLAPIERYLSVPSLERELSGSGLTARHLEAFEAGYLDQGSAVWKRMLAALVLNEHERRVFSGELPPTGPRREEWLVGRVCAKDAVRAWAAEHLKIEFAAADVQIGNRANGEPYVVGVLGWPAGVLYPAVSISHSRRAAVAVCGPAESSPGIDFQQLDRVDAEDLIAGAFSASESQRFLLSLPREELRRAAVALWCAKEAAAKSAGTGLEGRPQDWQISAADLESVHSRWVRVRRGAQEFAIELHYDGDDTVIALCRGAAVDGAAVVTLGRTA
jgi:acyl transferase domain-containing protein/phosphopantetheinyl transferase